MFFDDDQGARGDRESPAPFQVQDRRRFLREGQAGESETAAEGDGREQRFPTYVEKLHEKLRLSEAQVEAFQEKYQHAREELRAEVDEIRGRLDREYRRRVEQMKVELVGTLLEGIDNLERTIAAAEASGEAGALLEGVKVTHSILVRRLSKEGLEQVESEGARFNPERHEAVETAEVEPEFDGMVVATLQKGYRVGEKLVRPARVKVGRALNPAVRAAPPQMPLRVENEADDT